MDMESAYIIEDESMVGIVEFMTHDDYLSDLDYLDVRSINWITITEV